MLQELEQRYGEHNIAHSWMVQYIAETGKEWMFLSSISLKRVGLKKVSKIFLGTRRASELRQMVEKVRSTLS
ncbi:hypothetical protein GWI33_009792 [Rhynchophorus ferrugineus]|uniref:Uncharacterized protein n=1 Tax=Rhynchophorus ferrugineus TaxID=354439 RepID=A0A834ISN8_RHYFE|nr:hypothetical protein GWI33_009792 [Rhynchophorus ferrugineus]